MSVLSFLLRSLPFLFTCPRNYSLPLLFSITVPLGPPARSLSCSPRVLAATRKVHIRMNVDRNFARMIQPCFVVHARESTTYNEETAPCVVSLKSRETDSLHRINKSLNLFYSFYLNNPTMSNMLWSFCHL